MDYEKMLEEAYSQLPPETFKHERLEIPKPICTVLGSRTIFQNFGNICDILNRDPLHLMRFLSREMATAGASEGGRLIFQGYFVPATLERLVRRYLDEFVMCPVCKRPDTKIAKEKRLHFLVCSACGARSPIKRI